MVFSCQVFASRNFLEIEFNNKSHEMFVICQKSFCLVCRSILAKTNAGIIVVLNVIQTLS